MGHRDHPEPGALLRFLAGNASVAECRGIVRHLLAGCRECVKTTRSTWLLADSAMPNFDDLEAVKRPRRS